MHNIKKPKSRPRKSKGGTYTVADLQRYKIFELDRKQYIKRKESEDFLIDPILQEKILRKHAILINGTIYDVNALYEYLCRQDTQRLGYYRDAWNSKIEQADVINIEKHYNKVNKKHEDFLQKKYSNSPTSSIQFEIHHPLIRLNNNKYYDIYALNRYITIYMMNNHGSLPPCPQGTERLVTNPDIYERTRYPTITVVMEPYHEPTNMSLSQSVSRVLSYARSFYNTYYITQEQITRINRSMINAHMSPSYRPSII